MVEKQQKLHGVKQLAGGCMKRQSKIEQLKPFDPDSATHEKQPGAHLDGGVAKTFRFALQPDIPPATFLLDVCYLMIQIHLEVEMTRAIHLIYMFTGMQ